MTTINKSALVPYTPAEMFALVDDIDAYPEFLPGCRRTEVHSRSADEVRATIELSKGGVEKAFTTCNRSQPNKMIEVRARQTCHTLISPQVNPGTTAQIFSTLITC